MNTYRMTTQPGTEYVPEWTDGDKLRKVRRHLRMTQEEFAEKLEVKPSTYMAWEADRNRITELKVVARRIKMLTGTPLWWWFDTERPTPPDGGGEGLRLPRLDSNQEPADCKFLTLLPADEQQEAA